MPDLTALVGADWSGMVVCATQCYACQFDEHPNTPHTWGAPDDFEHAWATFQDAPGYCGCPCGRPARTLPRLRIRLARFGVSVLQCWTWTCTGCDSGKELSLAKATDRALAHRASAACKHRGVEP